jgi:hypothetical protein
MDMTRRIDEKEDLLYKLCGVYGFRISYSWGRYWITSILEIDHGFTSTLEFTREELKGWGDDKIESVLLGFYLEVTWG